MMNDKAFEKKLNQDVDKAMEDIATLRDDGVSGLTSKFDQLVGDVKKTVTGAVKPFGKEVEQGLSQYNTKIQEVADRVPGDFSKKVAGYPWVTITLSLAFGLLLGVLLKPGRQSV
jgi:ElaB/YqjD/DUF883 family membrane-anchored ribosome-binding protein